MNTCYYNIERYSFKSTKKIVSLEERKRKFANKLRQWAEKNDPNQKSYPKWLRQEFYDYWTALANDNGRTMNFERQKTWNTGLRLATWKRNCQRDKRWKSEEKPTVKINTTKGNYSEVNYQAAKERMSQEENTRGNIGSILKRKM